MPQYALSTKEIKEKVNYIKNFLTKVPKRKKKIYKRSGSLNVRQSKDSKQRTKKSSSKKNKKKFLRFKN